MSRSALMDMVRRALHYARGASRAGVPVAEYVEMGLARRQRDLSRRRFLQASAAGVGAGALAAFGTRALSACSVTLSTAPVSGNSDVIIVGAGLAGCHCAYRLRQLGVRADVYEASMRIGGRTYTDRTSFPEGMHVELGGELIDTGHVTLQSLAAELGIVLNDYTAANVNDAGSPAADALNMLSPTGWVMGKVISAMDLATAFVPLIPAIDAALATFTDPTIIPNYQDANGAAALDAMSIKQWMESAAMFSGPILSVLETAYLCEYGLELDVSNALNFLVEIGTDPTNFSIFGLSDERFTCANGNQTFVETMSRVFPDTIYLDSQLEALTRTSDGTQYIASFVKSNGSAFQATATHVVLALPFTLLRTVKLDPSLELPPLKTTAINQLTYGTNAKLIVGFSSRPWLGQNIGGGEMFTDADWQDAWETSRQQPGSAGIITNFRGGKNGVALGQGSATYQMNTFLTEFDQFIPGTKAASNGVVVRQHWPSAPFNLGSYAAYSVGQYTLFSGIEGVRVGNIHFCGEHTSTDFQGFMEGAAETGARAAMEILVDLGLMAGPPDAGAPANDGGSEGGEDAASDVDMSDAMVDAGGG